MRYTDPVNPYLCSGDRLTLSPPAQLDPFLPVPLHRVLTMMQTTEKRILDPLADVNDRLVMGLVDLQTGKIRCKICQTEKTVLSPSGVFVFVPGMWFCPNGCRHSTGKGKVQ